MNTKQSTSSTRASQGPNSPPGHPNAFTGFAALMNKYRRTVAGFADEDEDEEIEIKAEEELVSISSDDTLHSETFSSLQVAAFSSVIQEALDKIIILGRIGGLPNVKTTLEYHSVLEKYQKEDTQSFIFDPETLEAYEGCTKKQMLIKFQKDRSYIEEVLKEAHEYMVNNRNINKFMSRLRQSSVAEEERCNLLAETAENLAEVKALTAEMEKDKSSLSSKLHKKSEILGKLKDQYEDLIYENDIKYRYIDQWETARCAQNEVEMNRKEEYFTNIIREYQNNYQRENRINLEIETYLSEVDDTNTNDIEMWLKKYDKDLDAKEIDIQYLKEKREGQMTTLEGLSKLYAAHKQEIEEYLVQKEERRKQNELLQKMNAAATKIQAWWRGIMYRRGLGPYKKKKKGKKDKKGKKK